MILATSTLILWFYQLLNEIIQIKAMFEFKSALKYFGSLQNIGDLICLALIPVLCLTNYGETPYMRLETQTYMGALVSFFLISKCFDWLRVFEDTSFLIKLIVETMKDIVPFMALFMVSLTMFALPHTILDNINEYTEEEDKSLIGDLTGFGPTDAILKEY